MSDFHYTEAFALAMVRAAFEHGYYAGHADARAPMSEARVADRAGKYMAVEPLPAMMAAATRNRLPVSISDTQGDK